MDGKAAVALLLLAGSLAGCVQVELGSPRAEPAPPPGSPDDGVTTLRLTIVDSVSEASLAGAEVRLSVPGQGAVTKSSGADGTATFNVEPARSCSAAVSRAGYAARSLALDCNADRNYRVALGKAGAGGKPPSPSGGPSPGDPFDPSGNGTGEGNGTEGNQTARPFEPVEPSGSCGSLDSFTPVAPSATLAPGLALGWPLLEVTMAVVVDPAFVDAHPEDWRLLIQQLVADSSALFEDQVGVRLNLTLLDRLPDGSLAPGSGDGRQRATARGFLQANHPGAHPDLVAVILGADYEGTTAGQVECVHGAGYPDYAYLWAEYDSPRDPGTSFGVVQMFDDIPLKVLAHETGHLFAAHHHYSNCGEGLAYFSTDDALGVCDIMINDIGLASFHFGPTNRLVMRSYVEQIGIGDPV